ERAGDPLPGREQHVHLTGNGPCGDLLSLGDQFVGRLAPGREHRDDPLAGLTGSDDPPRGALDLLGAGHRGAAELHYDDVGFRPGHECLRIVGAKPGLAAAAEIAEHRLFGHADEAEAAVGAHVTAAHADMGAVRPHHLDDRADVADFAIVAVIAFDRLHLLGHDPADLALVERHFYEFLSGEDTKTLSGD